MIEKEGKLQNETSGAKQNIDQSDQKQSRLETKKRISCAVKISSHLSLGCTMPFQSKTVLKTIVDR